MPESQLQTSFIPKQVLTKELPRRSTGIGLVSLISFVILAIAIAIWVAAFGYRFLIMQQINSACPKSTTGTKTTGCGLLATLERERKKLDPNLLTRFRRLDAKSKIAKQIIDKHATLLPLFTLLNESTLQTIQYKRFSFGSTGVTIDGVAAGYEDIALQSRSFGQRREIKSFLFSGFALDDRGNVNFKLTMTIDPAFLSYRDFVAAAAAGPEVNETEDITELPVVAATTTALSPGRTGTTTRP